MLRLPTSCLAKTFHVRYDALSSFNDMQVFCQSCIERAMLTCEQTCPTCRAPMTKRLQRLCLNRVTGGVGQELRDCGRLNGGLFARVVRPNLVVRSLLNELQVRCLHRGCFWTGRLDERPAHCTCCLVQELLSMQARCESLARFFFAISEICHFHFKSFSSIHLQASNFHLI